MKKQLIGLTLMSTVASYSANAEYLYGFGSMHADYQIWEQGFGNDDDNFGNAIKDRNQLVIGIEGGAGFDWGEIFGFYDYEGVDRAGDDRGASAKGTIHYNLMDTKVSLYAQIYDTQKDSINFHEQSRVLGLGYTGLAGSNWGFKPFVGVQQINTANIHGDNGIMFGWVGYYNTEIYGEKFTFSTWGEYEINRHDAYVQAHGGENGLNGSANILWNFYDNWSAGVLYRFTENKLGREGYQDLLIYRVQYDF